MTFVGAVTAIATTIVATTIDATSGRLRSEQEEVVAHESALRLGLPFVPSYLCQSGSVRDMTRGSNYASAGSAYIIRSANSTSYGYVSTVHTNNGRTRSC
ncbi:hypothetical protein L1987_54460 [Smallanthus sonchifolius]|uniref:Uncharacterized protein n=1 Tax=Smallanthus sonchifolius TaxID=185202 RepID=A0ACB9E6P9_9ASTR|nr:hypothetical protein L1987_54460 [Smallanthus sonchifolius]